MFPRQGAASAASDVDLMVVAQEPFSTQRSCRAEYAYRKDAPNHVVG